MNDPRQNRAFRASMRKAVAEENKKRPRKLTEVPKSNWPENFQPERMNRVWHSRDFLVQEWQEYQGIRLSINRTEILRNGNWSDQISWDELQQIKSDVGYGEYWAFEVFPPDDQVVNVSNMRHLWIPDSAPLFGWVRN